MKLKLTLLTTGLLFLFTVAHSQTNSQNENADANSTSQNQQERPEAFDRYLTFLSADGQLESTIETPWIDQAPSDRNDDLKTIENVKAEMLRQLRFTLNQSIIPSEIIFQNMVFYKQVDCKLERTDKIGSYTQKVDSKSQGSGTTLVSSDRRYKGADERRADDQLNSSLKVTRSEEQMQKAGDTYSLKGHTVIVTKEDLYQTSCVKKVNQFRGVLNTQRLLQYTEISTRVKIHLTRDGIKKIHQDFVRRSLAFVELLNALTRKNFIGPAELKAMNFQSPTALISYLQLELSSLAMVYRFLGSAKNLFEQYNYSELSTSIGQMMMDARLKLFTIKSNLELYSAPALQVLFGDSQANEKYVLFSESFLNEIFVNINGFQFKGTYADPAVRVQGEQLALRLNQQAEEKQNMDLCQSNLRSRIKSTQEALRSAGTLMRFEKNQIEQLRPCSKELIVEYTTFASYDRRPEYHTPLTKTLTQQKCIIAYGRDNSDKYSYNITFKWYLFCEK